ncbi:MAG: helix-hairpin-helix domain-containing protein [Deltaproteobacteria bacterium]|nr:helix-hairpin-helix domain-containing protein [Candidatus Zymogenaceae bacterium]
MNRTEHDLLGELTTIPGVGPKTAADLIYLDIRSIADLRGHDPQRLYDELCVNTGAKVDRCMLYVFRCAVYYASTDRHDPELLKWWNWKDGRTRPPGSR